MKKLTNYLLITLLLNLFPISKTFASFPAKNNNIIRKDISNLITNSDKIQSKNLDGKLLQSKIISSKKTNYDEEFITLLVLWFFLGFFAAHRWYKGKPTGSNILFILTAGGCGIWAIYDLVLILTRKF